MDKSLIEPRTLKGFRDTLPQTMMEKEKMIDAIKKVYLSYGFLPIETPALEYAEILTGKGGEESDKQLYRFKDQGNRDVALRFDLTVPFARFTAQHYSKLNFPFKRYHIGLAWRGENTQAGRYREFMQCDFDTIGTTSILSDIETIAVTHDTIKALGIDNFTIHFNNRIILNGLLNKIDAVDKKVEILRTIDKLEKIGLDEVKKQLSENVKLNDKQISRLLSFISIKGTNENIIKDLKSNFSGEEKIDEGINKLETTIQSLQEMGITGSKAKINLSITRGLDYYTGIVFETFLNELPSYGSVCSGGRYDNLARLYTKNVLPGVGGSLGIDRLLAALEELNLINESSEYLDLLILNFDESLNKYYLSLANELRKEGIKTEVFPEAKKLQKQFAFADNKGFKLALVIGEKEKEKGAANLRIINTGERIDNIKKEELINTIKKYL